MTNKELFTFLKTKTPEIEDDDLWSFCNKWSIRKVLKKKEALNNFGKSTTIYFIKKGAVKIIAEIESREMVLEFGYAGLCVFNVSAFFSGKPSGYSLIAIKNTELIGIRKKDFLDFVDKNSFFSQFWHISIEQLLHNFVERQVDALTKSPQIKYERLKKRNPNLLQQIPQKHIAKYLGLSPETLSRLHKS